MMLPPPLGAPAPQPMTQALLPPPTVDPFGAFLPPTSGPTPPVIDPNGPTLQPPGTAQPPTGPGIPPFTPEPPPVIADGPFTMSGPAQLPWGDPSGNAPAVSAPGGADYPPFTNDATGRIGDSPFRRVKRGAMTPMAAKTGGIRRMP